MIPTPIRRAAVLGAGVMGAQIAAHLANVGIPTLLLDIVPTALTPEEEKKGLTLQDKAVRNRLAEAGKQRVIKSRPPALFHPSFADAIRCGNIEDDLQQCAKVDWVIEAVVERLDVKQEILAKVGAIVGENTIVSSNTSGISVAAMAEALPQTLQSRFLVTHFFNPPRYMRLLEVVPGPKTDPELVSWFREFGTRRLGKGVVIGKDTPNFIGNRIGNYGFLATLAAMQRHHLSIEEVDALTGRVMGHPNSATFRTLDMVGLDTMLHVAENTGEAELGGFLPILKKMIDQGQLGDKSGAGFYKKERGQRLVLDLESFTYRPPKTVDFPSLRAAQQATSLSERLRTLTSGEDEGSRFAWEVLRDTLCYAAERVPEIADEIEAIDNAMKWGFNWEAGPFEMWDALGVEATAQRIRQEGGRVPPIVEALLAKGYDRFYTQEGAFHLDVEQPQQSRYRPQWRLPERIDIVSLRKEGTKLFENEGASLYDIGDDVALLDLHGPKNTIDDAVIEALERVVETLPARFVGVVIGAAGKNFCTGANLGMMMQANATGKTPWELLETFIRRFQYALYHLKMWDRPVVAAPYQRTLGGGCEISFAADAIQADAETYIGLVETGVGLIPGGGGNKELYLRHIESIPEGTHVDLEPYLIHTFQTIAMATVSTSAEDARSRAFLRPTDQVSIQSDLQLAQAKQRVLALGEQYHPRQPKPVPVLGVSGYGTLLALLEGMSVAGQISDHDRLIATKLARVLTGGDVPKNTLVPENYLLDLEREAFLSLCGEPKTQQRIAALLTTGKPVRN